WRLARETNRGWQVIGSGGAGREPPSLVASPGGKLDLVAWPGGLPRLWTFRRSGDSWSSRVAPVPGTWLPSDWPYASAAIGPKGELSIIRSYDFEKSPEGGGELALATRDPGGAGWRFTTTRTSYRYCYPW